MVDTAISCSSVVDTAHVSAIAGSDASVRASELTMLSPRIEIAASPSAPAAMKPMPYARTA